MLVSAMIQIHCIYMCIIACTSTCTCIQTHRSPLIRASNTPLVLVGRAALRLVLLNDNRLPFLGLVVVENLAEENFILPLLLLKEGVDDPVLNDEKEMTLVGDVGYYMNKHETIKGMM